MPFKAYFEAINQEIAITKYGEHPKELYDPLDYIMSLGGKRLRPSLTLMAANLWLYNWQKAIKPAVAVEVFHNFTLMHDDIMDQAPLRRGKATVHEKWDTNTAILSGDVMLVAAYELLSAVEDRHFKRVIRRFNKTAAEVCEGQQLDMVYASKSNVTKAEYIEMIRLKTSVLLGFALELGAIVADADEESIRLLYKIGVNLGIGFQLKDDILDVYGDPEKFGKQIGGDIIENKKTWLMLDAVQKVKNTEHQKELDGLLKAKKFKNEEKIAAIMNIYEIYEVKAAAEDQMSNYFDSAFSALNKLKVSDDKKIVLKKFAEGLYNREN
jgi:geranylgeranyl diphosphate synthase, type II